MVIPDILLRLSFRRFKFEGWQGWTFFLGVPSTRNWGTSRIIVSHICCIFNFVQHCNNMIAGLGQVCNTTTPWNYNFMSLVQSNPDTMRFISYTLRVTPVISLLLYHLGMHNKWYHQNQTGSMNMLSEFCNAPQMQYPVPSLIEQRKISERGLLLASS